MKHSLHFDLNPRLALTIIGLCFLAFKTIDAIPRFSDGSIYLYMSSLLTQGVLPYRDFFFAHPPLQLVFLSPVTFLFDDNFFMTHMSLQLLLVANALVLYSISAKFFPPRISLLAALLYLFSYSTQATGAHWSGVHLALFLVLASLLLYLGNRSLFAGIVAGLAILTRYYALFPLAGILIAAALQDSKRAMTAAGAAFGTVLLGCLLVVPLGFENFWEQSVGYHLKKTEGIPKLRVLRYFASHEWLLVLGFIALLPILRDRKLWLIAFPQVVLLIFYFGFADVYYYYFALIVPFLILNLVHLLDNMRWARNKNFQWLLGFVVVAYLASSSYRYLTGHARIDNFKQLTEVSRWVAENAGSGDSIYGGAEITPLIALHSGVPITGHFVDTNQKTFLTGTVSMTERQDWLLRRGMKFFVTPAFVQDQHASGLDRYAEISFLEANCSPEFQSPLENSYIGNTLLIWDCKKQATSD